MFLSVCFAVKLGHLTKVFFLAYKKVDYETNCFSLTLHVICNQKN